jgi:transcriptional regulator with XRE-family HTH domain
MEGGSFMTPIPNTKLKTKLLEKGITQRDLAFGLKIDESRLSRIIRGYERPTFEICEAISAYLEAPMRECFNDSPKSF